MNTEYQVPYITFLALSERSTTTKSQARKTKHECLERGSKKKGVKSRNQGVRSGENLIEYLIPRNKYLCVELLNLAQLLVIVLVVVIVP